MAVCFLRIKHFDASFKGWEAQDKFQEFAFLVERDGKFCFEGITFAPQGNEGLTIYVASEEKGNYKEMSFEFRRVIPALTPEEPRAR